MSLHAQNPLSKVPLLNSVSTVRMCNVSSQWISSHSLSRLASTHCLHLSHPSCQPLSALSSQLFHHPVFMSLKILHHSHDPLASFHTSKHAHTHTPIPHTGILAHACTQMQVLNKWKILLIWFWYQCNLASRAGLAVYLPMQWDSRRGTSASSSLKVW